MFRRVLGILETVRPRTIARTVRSVQDLAAVSRELKRSVQDLQQASARNEERSAALEAEVRALRQAVEELRVREARLRTIYRQDIEQAPAMPALDRVLRADAIGRHLERAVEAASLHLHPFPHAVLEDLFPQPFYDALLQGIPAVEFFDGPSNKQRMMVPFELAPAYSRRVWAFLLEQVVDGALGPALVRKFSEPLAQWLRGSWADLDDRPLESLAKLQSTDGRILLRRRGYMIPPHRDPKWGFLTCLLYLARPGDNAAWGTQLYAVDNDSEASTVSPHWIRPDRCRLVKDVPFRANSALVFLNSQGAHGARIPEDAEPPDLERYIYQFRIGPTAASIRRLVAMLPEAQRDLWSGKVADYA